MKADLREVIEKWKLEDKNKPSYRKEVTYVEDKGEMVIFLNGCYIFSVLQKEKLVEKKKKFITTEQSDDKCSDSKNDIESFNSNASDLDREMLLEIEKLLNE